MKKVFIKVLSVFSFMCMFVFHVSIIGGVQDGDNISIAMATDNNYAYPTIVAMTSILENKSPKTKIDFYIMLSGNFDKQLIDKIDFLKNKYNKCSIYFINMGDDLKDLPTNRYFTTAIYYRFQLPNLLPNLDKILYMDVDTITQYDLSALFNIDIDNYYFAGIADKDAAGSCAPLSSRNYKNKDIIVEIFGGKEKLANMYVNTGILLLNLKKMRKDKLVEKLINFASHYKPFCPDQDTLNCICYNKIKNIDKTFNCVPYRIEDPKNQTIIHYLGRIKPWNNRNVKYSDIWWSYAKKSGLEKEIKKENFLQIINMLISFVTMLKERARTIKTA